MSDIQFCSEHGYFTGTSCSSCNRSGVWILSSERRSQISSFLSGLLRHFPSEYDLQIDSTGFTDFDTVLDIVNNKYGIEKVHLLGIVSVDDKGRYEINDGQIRAVYGHSIDGVNPTQYIEQVPDVLFHGTAPRFIKSIQKNGLQPQGRNEVHLTNSSEDAIEVGNRHSNSNEVILISVNAAQMDTDGYEFSSHNSVYTVPEVPPKYFIDLETRHRD